MSLSLTQTTNAQQLAALRPEWEALAGSNPFLSWDWADCWWRHYQSPTTRLFVLEVRNEAGQLVGLAPWNLRHTVSRGRTIQFIGSNEVCGDRLTILSNHEYRAAVLQRIAQALTSELQHAWDLVELKGVELANADIAELASLAQHAGNQVHMGPDVSCWKVGLPNSWEAYLASLSKPRRNRMRKMLRNSIDAGLGEQRTLADAAEFDAYFRILIELHQKRRNSIGEPGCFASEIHSNFHYEFASRMLTQHKLRLAVLYLHGKPAAVEYGFLGDGTIYHYQSGFDPSLSEAHPGATSLAATLRWAIPAGYHTFDMLRGDEPYKASLGAQPMPLVQTRIVGCQRSAKLRHLAWRTQAALKRWARRKCRRSKHDDREENACHPQQSIRREPPVAAE